MAPLESDEHLICLLNGDNSPFLKEVLSALVSEGLDRLRMGGEGSLSAVSACELSLNV